MVYGMGKEMNNDVDFAEFISKQNFTIFVEVGVFEGRSLTHLTNQLVKNNKNKFKVYGIDLFKDTTDTIMINKYGKERISFMYEKCIEKLKVSKIDHFVKIIKMDSIQATKQFFGSIDFVFIDASHKYEDILRDITAWYPKIRNGGIISGHDFTWEGVEKAVKEYFGNSYQTTIKKDIWFKRR